MYIYIYIYIYAHKHVHIMVEGALEGGRGAPLRPGAGGDFVVSAHMLLSCYVIMLVHYYVLLVLLVMYY